MMGIESKAETGPLAKWIEPEDQADILRLGRRIVCLPGEWLFHESTPRYGFGIIEWGEVEVLRELQGTCTRLAVLGPGAMVGEGAL